MNRACKLKDSGILFYDLSGCKLDFNTLTPIKESLIKSLNNNRTHYCVGKDVIELRKKVSKKLYRDNSIEVDIDDIIVIPGSKMTL